MRRLTTTIALALTAAACGGAEPTSSSGTTTAGGGGAGGNTTTISGLGGTGGMTTASTTSTGGAPDPDTFGPSAGCTGSTPFAPFSAALDQAMFPEIPLVDASGDPLEASGSLACSRFVPPSVPYVFDSWEMAFSIVSICKVVPDAVAFVAPKDATFPITVGGYQLASPASDTSPAVIPLDITIVSPDDALYVCARLDITADGRGCVDACKRKSGSSPDTLWSSTKDGQVEPLPTVDLEPLSQSPTPEIADYFGSSAYEFNHRAHGHAL